MRRFVCPGVLVLAGLFGAGCERETANRPPVARAGEDRIAFRGDSISLDGSESFDPDEGDTLSFAWRPLSGPTTVQGSTTATLSFDAEAVGSYVFELVVTDEDGAVASDVAAVEVGNVLSVARVVPADAASGVAGRQPVVVYFDAPLRPWTAAASVRVEDVTDPLDPIAVEGNVTLEDDGTAVLFSPVLDWVDLAEYRVTITTAAKGLDGAPLRAEVTSSFFGAAVDTVPPVVVAASPGPDAATDVPHSSFVEIVFSEPVDAGLLASALALDDSSGAVDGVVSFGAGGTRAFFVPADTTQASPDPQPLQALTDYFIRVAETLTDENGNALDGDADGTAGGDFTRSFRTISGSDTDPPTVLSISPLRGAQGVSVKLPVVITFSEPVEPATVAAALVVGTSSGAGFGAGGGLAGTLTMARGNTVAVFQPASNLATGTLYQVSLGTGVTDLAANPIPASFDSFFLTGDAPPPSVVAVLPDRGPIASTLTVQVQGEDFVDGATAFVPGGGVLVNQTTFLSATLLQAELLVSPTAQLGPRPVTVTNPDGQQGTGLAAFTILQRPPVVSALSPAAANQGQAAVPISVLGAEFQNGAAVTLSGTGATVDAGSVTFVNAGQLNMTVTVAAGATTGPRNVTVTNPDGQSFTLPNGFVVRLPAPTVTGITPGSGGRGENLFGVVISGTNFVGLPTVDLGSGVLASTVAADATSVTVNVTISGTATLGFHDVTVTNPDGQSATLTGPSSFEVEEAPPSVISSTPPVPRGESLAVTVNGANFQCGGTGPTLEVYRSGAPSAGVTVDNTTLLSCDASSFTRTVTVTGAAAIGLHNLRVTNPDGQTREGVSVFEVKAELPVLTSLTDTDGRRKEILSLTINGSFFQDAPSPPIVSFGPNIAVSVGTVTANTIEVTLSVTDAAALGARTVTVTNADGQSRSGLSFTVRKAAPDVVSVSPSPVNQGAQDVSFTITGDDFDCTGAAPTVDMGADITIDSVTCPGAGVSENSLTVVADIGTAAGGLGAHAVTVTNPDVPLASDTLSNAFTVREEAPTLAGAPLSDVDGRRKETLSLTITGTNFRAGATVSFGSNIAVSVGTVTATTIDVTLSIADAATLGARSVTVTHPDDGQFVTGGTFTVLTAAPDVTSVSPSPVNQGDQNVSFTISGDDFDCRGAPGVTPAVDLGADVSVDSVTCPGTGVSENSLTVVADVGTTAGAVGAHAVVVSNPEAPVASDTLLSAFTVREEAPTLAGAPLSDTNGRRKETLNLTISGNNFRSGVSVSFGPNIAVSVGAVTATTIDVTLSIADAAALGARSFTVTHPDDGQFVTSGAIFTVLTAAPDVVSVVPSPVNQGDQDVTFSISGDDFDCRGAPGVQPAVDLGPDVSIDSVTCPGTGVSENSLTVVADIGVTAGALGAHAVVVSNPEVPVASDTLANAFTVREEAPTLAATPLSDTNGRRKETLTVTISGANFRAGANVTFGANIAVSVGTITATTIEVTLTVQDGAALGARSFTVTHPDDGQLVTSGPVFTVLTAAPDVVSVSPTPVNQGDQDVTFTISGDDFDCRGAPGLQPAVDLGADVTIDSVTCPGTGVSENSLTVVADIGTTAGALGAHTVTVTNPETPVASDALANAFTVREEAPTLAATPLSDTNGRRKESLSLTISGNNFRSGVVVSFGSNIAVSVGTVTSTTIDVTLSIADGAALGARSVTVTHPDDGQFVTSGAVFTVLTAAPDVVSVAPSPVNQGDQDVSFTITGDDFDCRGAPGVTPTVDLDADITIDSITCPGTGVSENSLTVVADIGTAAAGLGFHDVTVTNPEAPAASDLLMNAFTVREEAPTLDASPLSDTNGRRKETLALTISGNNFRSGVSVSFGSNIAVSVGTVTATTIEVTLSISDAAALGPRNFTVTHPDDAQFATGGPFTVLTAAPDVASVSPSPVNQGDLDVSFTISGDDFDCRSAPGVTPTVDLGADITIDSVTCPGTGVSENALTVVADIGTAAASLGAHTVTVSNPEVPVASDTLLNAFTVREEAPTLAGVPLSDTDGRRKETLSLTINGNNFRSGVSVSFGSNIAVSVGTVTATTIDVTLSIADAAALGARSFTVTHPDDGQFVTSGNVFTVLTAAPDVVSVSPSPVNQGDQNVTFTISGDDFDCRGAPGVTPTVDLGADVSIDSVTCPGTGVSENGLTVVADIGTTAGALGAHSVVVSNPEVPVASDTLLSAFTVREEAPTLAGAPLSDTDGRRKETLNLTISGTNFRSGVSVSFGPNIAVSVGAVTATTIDVTLSIADAAALGARSFTVTHPDDGQFVTSGAVFTVLTAAPDVVSVAPSPVNQGDQDVTFTISGDDFDCRGAPAVKPTVDLGADVSIDSVTCPGTGVSENSLTVVADIGTAAAGLGGHAVVVSNPEVPVASDTLANAFTVREEAPTLAATPLSDTDGRRKETLTVTISGGNFRAGANVTFGPDIAVSVGAITATTIDVTLTVQDGAALGARSFTVTHPDDGQLVTSGAVFTVRTAAPDVVSVAPSPVNQGDQNVSFTLTGDDFDCRGAPGVQPAVDLGTDVTIDSITCPGTGVSENTLTVVADIGTTAGALGAHTVTVTNPEAPVASDALANAFTVREEAPTLAATPLSDTDGRRKETLSLTITGNHFRSGAVVSFGSNVAVSVGAITTTTIDVTLTVQDGAALGARSFSVTHPDDGQSVTSGAVFTVLTAAPDVVSVTPSPVNQGDQNVTFTISGDDFDCRGAPGVVPAVTLGSDMTIDSVACPGTGVSENSLTVVADVGTTAASFGAHPVTVTNPEAPVASDTLLNAFSVREEAPALAGAPLSDTDGRRKETLSLTISGSNFRSGVSVSFGGGIAVSVGTVTATTIDVTLSVGNAAALGARSFTVTHPDDGQSVTSGAVFTVLTAAPELVSVGPSPVNQGAADVSFTLTGDDFDCRGAPGVVPAVSLGSDMTIDSITCPGTTESENTLTVVADVGSAAAGIGAHAVTVTNPEVPTASDTLLNAFTVREEAPVLTELRSSDGASVVTLVSQKSSYSNLRVVGNFFQAGATVSMGSDVTVTAFTVQSATRIDVSFTVLASAPIGDLTITVNNPDGQSIARSDLVDVRRPEPRITGVTPPEGNRGSVYAGASAIEVSGTDFDCTAPGPTVTIGGTSFPVSACTATLLDVDVDLTAATLGLKDVTVQNPDTQSHTQTGFFEVLAEEPIVTSALVLPALASNQGRRAQSLQVRVTGDFFQNAPSLPVVSFGAGVAVTGVTFVNAQTLDVDVSISPDPAFAPLGFRTVRVTNADTQFDELAAGFEVLRAVPTISTIVRNDDGTSVGSQLEPAFTATVTGDHFDCSGAPGSVPNVELGGGVTVNAESCGASTSQRATTLTATVDIGSGTVGLHNVVVTNPGDTVSGTGTNLFTVREERPVLTSVSPSIRQGETLTMTLTGDFFQATPTSITTPAGTVSSIVWVNAQTVTFTLAVALSPTLAGSYDLSLTNPDGQSRTAAGLVTVLNAPAPSISSVCNPTADCGPAWIDRGANDRQLTINGADFQPSVSVTFNPSADISDITILSVTSTVITLRVDVGATATLGARDVTVTNLSSSPTQATTATGQITVTEVAPTVSTIAPPDAAQGTLLDGGDGAGGTPGVTLTGSGFRAGAVVHFLSSGSVDANITVGTVTVVDANNISIDVVDVALSATIGLRDVRVTNTDGSEGRLTAGFEVLPGAGTPFVTRVVRDPVRGAATSRTDTANSIRQGTSALFHLMGGSFAPSVTVTISGTGVTAGAATVDPTGTRIDVTLTAACGDLLPGARDIVISNAAAPVGNGLTGICQDCLVLRNGVVINEVSTTNAGAFERAELFNGSGCTLDITGWRLDILEPGTDTTNTGIYVVGSRTADETYSTGASRTSFVSGGYMTVNRPFDDDGDTLDDDAYFALHSKSGRFVDDLEVGGLTAATDVEGDGTGDGAPSATDNGDAAAATEEMVGRCPNGSDTDDDIADFFQEELGAGANGMAITLSLTNDPECSAECSDGADNDGDGWVDMLDPGCTDPHTDDTEAGGVTVCNDGLDNDGDLDGVDEADPDCFDGLDTDESI